MRDADARWAPVMAALDKEGVRYARMPAYPDYLVVEDGRIYSGRKIRIKRLANRWSVKGYACVRLFNDNGGKHFPVHRIVAIAFLGPPENGSDTHVNHRDGSKSNNHISNLEWCTNLENVRHARAMGLHRVTEEQRAAFEDAARARRQLKSCEAAEILREYTGYRGQQRVLALRYGVDHRVIWKLVNKMTYKEIEAAQ